MSSHNEKQIKTSEDGESEAAFRDMNRKEKIATIAGITLLIVFLMSFVFGMYFFGLAGIYASWSTI